MKMHLKMTLYLKLAIAENFFTEETKTEAQSANFKIRLDKRISFLSTTGQYSRRQTHLRALIQTDVTNGVGTEELKEIIKSEYHNICKHWDTKN